MTRSKKSFVTRISRQDQHAYDDQASDGRYVPYSGGTMGWLDQQEIPTVETKNNYGYASDIPASEFRAMRKHRLLQFKNPHLDRAKTKKQRVVGEPIDIDQAVITLHWDEQTAQSIKTAMSVRSVKLSFNSKVPLEKGDKVLIHLVDHSQPKAEPLQVATEVAWLEEAITAPLSWHVGLEYSDMNPASHLRHLQLLLEGGVDEDEAAED